MRVRARPSDQRDRRCMTHGVRPLVVGPGRVARRLPTTLPADAQRNQRRSRNVDEIRTCGLTAGSVGRTASGCDFPPAAVPLASSPSRSIRRCRSPLPRCRTRSGKGCADDDVADGVAGGESRADRRARARRRAPGQRAPTRRTVAPLPAGRGGRPAAAGVGGRRAGRAGVRRSGRRCSPRRPSTWWSSAPPSTPMPPWRGRRCAPAPTCCWRSLPVPTMAEFDHLQRVCRRDRPGLLRSASRAWVRRPWPHCAAPSRPARSARSVRSSPRAPGSAPVSYFDQVPLGGSPRTRRGAGDGRCADQPVRPRGRHRAARRRLGAGPGRAVRRAGPVPRQRHPHRRHLGGADPHPAGPHRDDRRHPLPAAGDRTDRHGPGQPGHRRAVLPPGHDQHRSRARPGAIHRPTWPADTTGSTCWPI